MKPKKILIYYFSGTGNTERVSNLFLKEFENHGVQSSVIEIDDSL